MPLFADLNGDGYYRVQSAYTKRYAYLTDNKGSYSIPTTSADVGALELFMDPERVLSDPATVFFFKAAPESEGKGFYDICGQNTSIYGFMELYARIYQDKSPYDGATTYSIYASLNGVAKYIGDLWDHPDEDEGLASADAKGDFRKWYIDPISADGDQYFGIAPQIQAGGKYYSPFFADFPFSAYSDGLKFYTISEIDNRGAAIINEVNGVVARSTPVVIECGSPLASSNRLNIGGSADAISGNKLKGVYFCNRANNLHKNLTPFNKETMRVLGIGKDGRLAFVEGNYDYIPRNQAYLQLTDPAQYKVKEFILMTSEQRDIEFSAVETIALDSYVDVYGIDGNLLKSSVSKSDVPSLGKGLYILKSGDKSEKMIVH